MKCFRLICQAVGSVNPRTLPRHFIQKFYTFECICSICVQHLSEGNMGTVVNTLSEIETIISICNVKITSSIGECRRGFIYFSTIALNKPLCS